MLASRQPSLFPEPMSRENIDPDVVEGRALKAAMRLRAVCPRLRSSRLPTLTVTSLADRSVSPFVIDSALIRGERRSPVVLLRASPRV